MTQALIALGGNVGDARATLKAAIARFADGTDVHLVRRSADYSTPPWGVTDQPAYVNAAIMVETVLDPYALLRRGLEVETVLGRDRRVEVHWGPRAIDIDLIAYRDLVLHGEGLTLPHPHVLERAFVLVPLAEIAPDWLIAGRRIKDAVTAIDTTGIQRLPPAA